MSYVENNLMPGEYVAHQGTIHWFIFVPGAAFFLIGLSLSGSEVPGLGGLIIFLSLFSLLKALFTYIGTELAVTNKRVIAKTGLIRRNTIELNHAKVESFNVDQGIMGRIFGFGTVTVNGTGGVRTPIRAICEPLEFRRKAIEQMEEAQPAGQVALATAS
jgi:uncharacterized membrane protein YdbT with pleckstrin-like domain